LNHRGEELVTRDTISERLKQILVWGVFWCFLDICAGSPPQNQNLFIRILWGTTRRGPRHTLPVSVKKLLEIGSVCAVMREIAILRKREGGVTLERDASISKSVHNLRITSVSVMGGKSWRRSSEVFWGLGAKLLHFQESGMEEQSFHILTSHSYASATISSILNWC